MIKKRDEPFSVRSYCFILGQVDWSGRRLWEYGAESGNKQPTYKKEKGRNQLVPSF
jgi:hypothetical protein